LIGVFLLYFHSFSAVEFPHKTGMEKDSTLLACISTEADKSIVHAVLGFN
jgi:hypothetical protein